LASNDLEYRLTLKDQFKKTMQGAASETKRLDSAMGKLDGRLSSMGKAVAGYFAFSTLKNFGSEIIDSLKNYESFSASLRTLMYGDKETAKALENQLVTLASKTPFSLVDVQQGTKQLLAYGFQAGQITKTLTTLGDVSSGVGAPLTDIVYLYGTLKTQGRAFTKDIMQFTSRGIPIIKELAKQFGVTEDKVQGLVEAGKVGFPQIERAFSDMTKSGGQFFGMMSEQSKTVGGQLSNLGDAWEQLKVNIGKSQTGIINSTISWANNMVSNFNRAISALNDIEQAFTKSGAEQFSFKERADDFAYTFLQNISFGKLGQQSAMDYYRNYQTTLTDQLNSAKTKSELLGAKAGLYLQRNELRKQRFTDKTLNESGFERMMAITDAALSRVEGSLKLLSVKPQLTESALKSESATKSGGSTVGSSVDVYGNRPQNINITLDRLGDITINGTTITEDAKQVKDIWSKQLLEVLNDANLIAR
jgi:tape measure domain-containing protein